MQLISGPNRGRLRRSAEPRRAGLAPLELVLMLPLLLMILALIINFGHEIAWKERALTVSRQAEWRQRPTHYAGQRDRQPREWPTSATMTVELAPAPPIFPQDPFAQHQVVRGPILRSPFGGGANSQLQVDTRQFDFSDDLKQGRATITRDLPLLSRLYQTDYDVKQPLLESEWRFHDMGYGSNHSRRILRLYGFTPPQGVVDLAQQYQQAAMQLLNAGYRPGLDPLDKDEELAAWYGSAPDFHPQLPRTVNCELDRDSVYVNDVRPLIDSIQGPRGRGQGGVPERLANAFLQMYRAQQNQLRQQDPPPQAQIDLLQVKINQLSKFVGGLR